jgi:hypothetical protein
MRKPSNLHDALYPSILKQNLPKSVITCLKSSLDEDPKLRTSFQEMWDVLASDTSMFGSDGLRNVSSWISIKLMEWDEEKAAKYEAENPS